MLVSRCAAADVQPGGGRGRMSSGAVRAGVRAHARSFRRILPTTAAAHTDVPPTPRRRCHYWPHDRDVKYLDDRGRPAPVRAGSGRTGGRDHARQWTGHGGVARVALRGPGAQPGGQRLPPRGVLPRGRGHPLPAGARAPSSGATDAGRSNRRGRPRTRPACWSCGPRTPPASTAPCWSTGTTSPPATRTSAGETAPRCSRAATPSSPCRPNGPGSTACPTNPQGLMAWDPERYGSLSIASDDDSYDIFSQAARGVAPGRVTTAGTTVPTRWAGSGCAGSSPRGRRSRPAGWPPT